jgi:3-oxoacyl-[acyl-carrier-protein] synthase II
VGVIETRGGRRVVVTGLGVVAPCGIGVEAFWAGLRETPKPDTVRCVEGFDPADWGMPRQEARRLDRFAQFAVAAAAQALADAGLPDGTGPYDPDRCGVILGTGIGGALAWEQQVHVLDERGERFVSPLTIPLVMPNAASAALSMRWGWRGPVETVSTACASGTHAVGNGARLVASGRCDAVLVGGAESCLTPTNVAGFTNMRAMSATGVSRPFDTARDGFCAAEAAAVLVLE